MRSELAAVFDSRDGDNALLVDIALETVLTPAGEVAEGKMMLQF